MFALLKNLAIFGFLFAAWNWLNQRVCKNKEAPADASEPEQNAEQ